MHIFRIIVLIFMSDYACADILGVIDTPRPNTYFFEFVADNNIQKIPKEEIIGKFNGLDLLTASREELDKVSYYHGTSNSLVIRYKFPYPKGLPKIHTLIQGDKAYWINSSDVNVMLTANFFEEDTEYFKKNIGAERFSVSLSISGLVKQPIARGGIVILSKENNSASNHKLPIWRGRLGKGNSEFRQIDIESKGHRDNEIIIKEDGVTVFKTQVYVGDPKVKFANYWELPNKDMILIISYEGVSYPGLCSSSDLVIKIQNSLGLERYDSVGSSCQGYYAPH